MRLFFFLRRFFKRIRYKDSEWLNENLKVMLHHKKLTDQSLKIYSNEHTHTNFEKKTIDWDWRYLKSEKKNITSYIFFSCKRANRLSLARDQAVPPLESMNCVSLSTKFQILLVFFSCFFFSATIIFFLPNFFMYR